MGNLFSKPLFLTIFIVAGIIFQNSIIAQCPTAADAACSMAASQYDNVVLGELSGDSGQSDGCNDGIVEIVGPPGTNIGCMVVSNSEWAVLIPPGTTIGADGVFLIACFQDESNGCGVGGSFADGNGLYAMANGDFNIGIENEIDLDVCDPLNQNYYDPAATGFTLDNSNASDGDQVMMWRPNGAIHDGIYWGATKVTPSGTQGPGGKTTVGGASGSADHVTIQVSGQSYTLGDNDGNGIVNDVVTTVTGGRGDTGNATAVPVLPTNAGCPCNTLASPGTFTMPSLSDSDFWFDMNGNSATFVGCNSSYGRVGTSAGSHGNPSHIDGLVTSASTDATGQPIDNGGGASGTTGDPWTPSSYTPSSCVSDPTSAIANEWGYTDHPTPGVANNETSFVFYGSKFSMCTSMKEDIKFTVEIYNYQHVSDNTDILSGTANIQAGSYVYNPITGTQQVWDTYTISGETTIMEYTISGDDLELAGAGIYQFGLVWDDYSNCCGTSGTPHSQSNPNECYEVSSLSITVTEPLVAIDDEIECPGDSPMGAINASNFVIGGNDLTYELFDTIFGTPKVSIAGPQSSGTFLINTSATMGPYVIVVTDGSGCSDPILLEIADDCEEAPVCPESFVVTIDGAAGPVATCPGSMVELCFDGDQLPPGGTVVWQVNDGSGFIDIQSFDIPEPAAPVEGYISEFIYNPSNPNPTGCVDGTEWGNTTGSGNQSPEAIELVLTPNGNITGWTVGDGTGTPFTFPSGSTVPIDGVVVVCGGGCIDSEITGGCDYIVTTFLSFNLGNGGDEIILSDNTGAVISAVSYEGGDCGTLANCIDFANGDDESVQINADGTAYAGSGQDYGNFGTANGPGVSSGSASGGYDSTPADKTFCVMHTIADVCPIGSFAFRAVVDPFDSANCPVGAPDEADGTSISLTANVSCPQATITAASFDLCSATSPAMIPVTITGGTGPFTLVYAVNGDNGATHSSTGTLSGFNSGDVISYASTVDTKLTLVSITDEMGALCTGTINDAEVCLTSNFEQTLTISGSTQPSSCSPCDGTVTFDIDGGSSSSTTFDLEYTFNGSIFSLGSITMPYVLNGACPGNYDISSAVSTNGECPMLVVGNAQTLNQPTGSPIAITTQPATVCNDGTEDVDLSAVVMDPVYAASTHTFYSADPNTLPSFALASAEVGPTLTGVTANQTVWVQYGDMDGCMSTAQIMVVSSASVCCDAPTLSATTTATCNGESEGAIDLMPAGGSGIFTYAWTGPSAFTATTQDLMNVAAGNYNVSLTVDGNAACTATAMYTISSLSAPAITATTTNTSSCGGNNGSMTISGLTASANYTIAYSGATGIPASGAVTTANASGQIVISSLTAGMYTGISVTDASGCMSNVLMASLADPTSPTVTAPSNQEVCAGEMTSLVTLTGSAGATFNWTNNNTSIGLAASGSGTIPTFATVNTTATDVVATIIITPVMSGCTGMAQMFTITATALPQLNSVITASCANATDGAIDLTVTGSSPFSYLWSNSAITQDLSGLDNGVYSVTVTDDDNCTSTASYQVDDFSKVNCSSSNTGPVCTGDYVDLSVMLGGGSTTVGGYVWAGPSGLSSTVQNPRVDPAVAGVYTVTVTYGGPDMDQCSDVCMTTVVVNTAPTISDAVVCTGSTVNMIGSGTANATDPYVSSNTSVATVSSSGVVSGITAGTSIITYTDSNGCEETAMITVSTAADAGTGSSSTICESSITTIDLAAQVTGEDIGGTWTMAVANPAGGTFNAAAGSFNPTGAGIGNHVFTYTIAAAGGCPADDASVTVIVEDQPEAGTDGTAMICAPSTVVINLMDVITGEDTGGVWTETTAVPSGALTGSSFDPSGITMGTYTFEYNFGAGVACLADMSTATIMIMNQPEAGTGSATSVCASSTTNINLAGLLTGADAGGTWTSDVGNPAGGVFNAAAGTYNPSAATAGVHIFNYAFAAVGNCMSDNAVVMVEVLEVPSALVLSDLDFCDGDTPVINPAGDPMTDVELLNEGFEGDPSLLTTATPQFTDSEFDFFTVTDGSNIGSNYNVTGMQGAFYFAAQDLDGEGGLPSNTLSFTGINIAGKTNLNFSALFAEDDDGSAQDWDNPDFVHIDYQVDGGGYMPLIWFENDGSSTNSEALLDTDFDGVGDGIALTSAFEPFSASIPSGGAMLDIRITFQLDSGDEDIAIDDVMVTGDMAVATTCVYNVYDSNPALGGAILLANGVMSYNPMVATGESEDYYITQICSNMCESPASRVEVSVHNLPTCAADSNSPICADDDLELTETGGIGAQWAWTGPNGFSSIDQNPTIDNATAAAAGTYTVIVTDTHGCTSSCTEVVTVNSLPVITTSTSDPTTCGGSDGSFTINGLTATANYVVNYSGGVGSPATGSIATASASGQIIVSGLSAAMYTGITVSDANTCSSNIEMITLSDPNAPVVDAIANAAICAGASSTAIDFTGTAGATFTWTNDTPSIGLAASGTGNIAAFTGVNATTSPVVSTIMVTPTLLGCTGTTIMFTITINPLPEVTAGADASVCEGTSASLNGTFTSTVGTPTYLWTAASGTFSSLATIEDPAYTNATTGDHTLTLTVSDANGCTDSDEVVITIVPEVSAGSDGSVSRCNAVDPQADAAAYVDLFDALGGTPNLGGTWVETSSVSSGVSLVLPTQTSFEFVNAGTYTFEYTVTATAPCLDARAVVTVTVTDCFDLALQKMLTTSTQVVAGDVVMFTLTVFNQGTVDAYDIDVTDYIPTDLLFSATANTATITGNDNDWLTTGSNAVTEIDYIAAGQSDDAVIFLQISPSFTGTMIVNDAEITFATNSNNQKLEPDDQDSNTNDDFGNASEVATDNEIDDESIGGADNVIDEDDFDPAAVVICPSITVVAQPQNIYVCNSSTTGIIAIEANVSDGSALTFVLQEDNGGGFVTIQTNTDDTNGSELVQFTVPNVNMGSSFQIIVSAASSVDPLCPVTSNVVTATVVGEVPLVCNGDINVSVNDVCEIPFTIETLIEGENPDPSYNASLYSYMFLDADGNVVDEADLGQYLNQTLTFKVTSNCSPNSCWGSVTIEDKTAPALSCPDDVTIQCFDSYTPLSTSYITANHLIDNCNDATVIMTSDRTQQLECTDPLLGDYTAVRTICYMAQDAQGLTSEECCYEVFYSRIDFADIVFPIDQVVNCVNYPTWNSSTLLGTPSIATATGTHQIVPGVDAVCAINAVYSDEILPICGSEYKVLRDWTAIDWCSGAIEKHTQIIKVEADGLFVTTDLNQYTADVDTYECTASWSIPAGHLDVNGICTADYSYQVFYLSSGVDNGVGNCPPSFPGAFTQLPGTFTAGSTAVIDGLLIGCNWIKYVITTECAESQEITVEVYVQDQVVPHAICEKHTVATLNALGATVVNASSIDDGSFDDCSTVSFGMRRLSGSCSTGALSDIFGVYGGLTYYTSQNFCCSDLGADIPVELIIVDESGNYSTCMGYVQVDDISEPVFTCPDMMVTTTHNCDYSADPDFGMPSYTLGSQICEDVYSVREVDNIRSTPNDCGDYRITKKWNIVNTSTNDIVHTCAQVINMNNGDEFDNNDIDWPNSSVSLSGCINVDTTPAITGEPQYIANACSLIAHSYRDNVFSSVQGVCYEIVRTWTVIDWCQYDASMPSGDGIWTYTQLIEVSDTNAPNPIAPNVVFDTNVPNMCQARDTISVDGNDNCDGLMYEISFDNGVNYIDLGTNNKYVANWSLGSTTVLWKVTDLCRNYATVNQTITVQDNKAPTPYCLGNISVVLMPSTGTIELWASDFDLGAEDDCDNDVRVTFGNGSTNMTFDCGDVGFQIVEIHFTDDHGNSDFCQASINIQDNSGACDEIRLGGEVYNEFHEMLEEVEIQLMDESTDIGIYDHTDNGMYAFDPVTPSHDYMISAYKNDDYMNGVSTLDLVLIQKHLLQIQELDSPYKLLAADVNNSGGISAIDLIQLRKLILGIYEELPSNESWRFVDATQQFGDPSSPWPFTETIHLDHMMTTSVENDFIAVKVGDVNNTALANATSQVNVNRSDTELTLIAHATERVGDNQVLRVSSNNFNGVLGFQGSLDYPKGYELESIQSGSLTITEGNYRIAEQGSVVLSWNTDNALDMDSDATLFSIVLKATSEHAALSLKMTDQYISSEAYNESHEVLALSIKLSNDGTDLFVLHQNVPNPFVHKTIISFELPEDEHIEMRIYDLDGKTLKTIKGYKSKGLNSIEIDREEFGSTGVLYYTLEAGKYMATRKMIAIE